MPALAKKPILSSQSIAANLAGKTRYAMLNGRQHLVAPITLIVPGVLNGSQGALYYPSEEVEKSVATWNYMPLVIYHPTLNGMSVSARTPQVLNEYCVGVLLNSKFDGKLMAEGWFDVDATMRIDADVLNRLLSGQTIEISTGLLTENEDAEEGAEYNGVAYEKVARNYKPDHLAILPEEIGACSIADGCGVLANRREWPKVKEYIKNQISHSELDTKLGNLIAERFGGALWDNIYIEEVFDKQVIFRREDKLWRLGYKTDLRSDDNVTLSDGEPVEIKRVIKYKQVTNTKGKVMDKKQRGELVASLVENCCYEEEDSEVLNGLSDKGLESLKQQADKSGIQETVIKSMSKEFADEAGNKHVFNQKTNEWETTIAEKKEDGAGEKKEELVTNKKPQTKEEWLEKAPPEIQSAVKNAMAIEAREREALVGQLTADVSDEQKSELVKTLNSEGIEKLRILKALAPKQKDTASIANYEGAATPLTNQASVDRDDILPDIEIDFSKEP